MALEIRPFGVESLFLVPGAFPEGTDQFVDAQSGDDPERNVPYGALMDRLPALTERIETIDREEGLKLLVHSVGEQLAQALEKPVGERASHVFIDGQAKGADIIAEAVGQAQSRFIERLGFGDLLPPHKTISK